MHIYDTLILGCGYSSAGYAIAKGNCIICEEHQLCDTHFTMPLRSFRYTHYTPTTPEGKRLLDVFSGLALFDQAGNMQNTTAFECGFCQFLMENPLEILLKCRVTEIAQTPDGLYQVTLQTNEGLSLLFAKRVLNTLGTPKEKSFTVLLTTENYPETAALLAQAFPNSTLEPAFYESRYALHIPADGCNENDIKLQVYETLCQLPLSAKVIYMAPFFAQTCAPGGLCDDHYDNPLEAFEAGFFYGEETK